MLVFALIGLCLVLLGIVGLQFTYMFYVDRMYNERRRYLQQLEHKAEKLTEQLEAAQKQLAEQDEVLRAVNLKEEAWADLIDER